MSRHWSLAAGTAQDVQFAARSFLKNPGFAAAVIASVALAIGANSTVFSMVNGLLLGALPVREPDRLVTFANGNTLSYPDYIDYRDQTRDVFEGVTAHFPLVPASIGGNGQAERMWGQLAAGDYFSIVGVRPVLGRTFVPEEDAVPGRDAVVVLSHSLWQRRFGGSPGIIGRGVVLNNARYTVIGVAPAGFQGTDRLIIPEFWVPLAMYAQIMPDLARNHAGRERNSQWLIVEGRLKPGVTREQAQAAVSTVLKRLDDTYRKGQKRRDPMRLRAAGGLPGGSTKGIVGFMSVLMAVVGMVLLVACANVANLMLARATGRQREIGIRLAVGASRWRLVRQLLTEAMLLSLAGAAGGYLLAYAAARAISQLQLPLPVPLVFDFTPDARVFWFTAGLAVATGIVFGLAPALKSTRPDLVATLKEAQTGPARRFGLRDALVVVQVGLSLVLLIGSGLFLRSLRHASSIDLGLRPDNVALLAVDVKASHYSPEKTRLFLNQLRQRVSALPGVASVSYLDSIPLSIGGTTFDMKRDDKPDAKAVDADIYMAGTQFFDTMGMRLLRGRDFRASEGGDTAIVNQTLASRMFPGEDPIGRRISAEKKSYEIIGIVRDFRSRTLGEDAKACAFLSLEAHPEEVFSFYGISVVVKATGGAGSLFRAIRGEIAALDPNLAVFNAETMEQHVGKALLVPRLAATLLGIFGGAGLILASLGLYGVMSYSVRRRTREIGIRMALGAPSAGVLRMVARQGMAMAGLGLAGGLALSFGLSRFTASMLYGISSTDGLTFLAVPSLLLAVAFVAVVVPARWASRMDPLEALRYE